MESTAGNIRMNGEGLLGNIADAGKVAGLEVMQVCSTRDARAFEVSHRCPA